MVQQQYKNYPNKRVSGLSLGLVADSKRSLLPGTVYNKLFPNALRTDPILNEEGTVYDTIEYCAQIVLKTLKDTKLISKLLKRGTLNDTCKAIFDFYYKHIQYEIDKPGVEQLRRPARAWQDRTKGIDCDCFTISVSSILTNLGIPHALRMVKLYGRDYFQHIYVIVPKFKNADLSQRNNYYVIDPVLNHYNEEATHITEKKDKHMTMQGMPIQFLNGVGNTAFGEEFNGLGDNLGETDLNGLYNDYCRRCKMHLINTRNHIATRPRQVSHIYDVKGLLGAYDQLIGAWDNEDNRSAMLDKLSGTEELLLQPAFRGLGDIIHGTDNELFGLVNADFEGIGTLEGKKRKARAEATGSSQRRKKSGVFTKMKHANRMAKGKGKGVLKKIARAAFLKYNPAIIPIRAGFLAAMKINTLRIASRVYWALFSEAQAVAAGVSRSFYRKAVKGLEFIKKLFSTRLAGNFDALKKAIITGRAAKVAKKLAKKGKLNGFDGLMGIDGLGVVTTATVAAAMTFLTAVAGFLTKAMGKKGNEGKEESETGGETESTSADVSNGFHPSDTGPITRGDNSEAMYNRYVKNQSGGGETAAKSENSSDEGDGGSEEPDHAARKRATAETPNKQEQTSDTSTANSQTNASTSSATQTNNSTETQTNTADEKKGSGAGLLIGVLAAIGLIAATSKGSKKKDASTGSATETKTEKTKTLEGVAKKAIKKKIKEVTLT